MSKKSYVFAVLLLAAAMAFAACGGASDSGDSAATMEADAAVTSEAQGEPASSSSGTSGAGDASGANATGEASTATDVGSGSDGAAGSGGSDGAGGATSPESDTGAPAAGDDTGNAVSGTGGSDSQAAAVSYMAISDAECTEIQGQLSQALGVEVNRTTGVASFSDLSGGTGESCQLTVTGTGVNFAGMPETAALIRQALSDNGWTVDEQYAADSLTGTMGGLRRDNQLAAYSVQWQPAAGVTCPADQPISACAETLMPEQMDYRITVDLAQQ